MLTSKKAELRDKNQENWTTPFHRTQSNLDDHGQRENANWPTGNKIIPSQRGQFNYGVSTRQGKPYSLNHLKIDHRMQHLRAYHRG